MHLLVHPEVGRVLRPAATAFGAPDRVGRLFGLYALRRGDRRLCVDMLTADEPLPPPEISPEDAEVAAALERAWDGNEDALEELTAWCLRWAEVHVTVSFGGFVARNPQFEAADFSSRVVAPLVQDNMASLRELAAVRKIGRPGLGFLISAMQQRAKSRVLDAMRKIRCRPQALPGAEETLAEAPGHGPTPIEEVIAAEQQEFFDNEFMRLGEGDRLILGMRRDGFSSEEIAGAFAEKFGTECTTNKIDIAVCRLRKQLRSAILRRETRS